MIYINGLRDLRRFGIDALTGEADALSLRVLCDLTPRGRKIVALAMGINENGFPENWNSSSQAGKHVASCLIDPHQFRVIATICLLDHGCDYVLIYENGTVSGTEGDEKMVDEGHYDENLDKWIPEKVFYRDGVRYPISENHPWPIRIIKNRNSTNYRNEHAMSGRTL